MWEIQCDATARRRSSTTGVPSRTRKSKYHNHFDDLVHPNTPNMVGMIILPHHRRESGRASFESVQSWASNATNGSEITLDTIFRRFEQGQDCNGNTHDDSALLDLIREEDSIPSTGLGISGQTASATSAVEDQERTGPDDEERIQNGKERVEPEISEFINLKMRVAELESELQIQKSRANKYESLLFGPKAGTNEHTRHEKRMAFLEEENERLKQENQDIKNELERRKAQWLKHLPQCEEERIASFGHSNSIAFGGKFEKVGSIPDFDRTVQRNILANEKEVPRFNCFEEENLRIINSVSTNELSAGFASKLRLETLARRGSCHAKLEGAVAGREMENADQARNMRNEVWEENLHNDCNKGRLPISRRSTMDNSACANAKTYLGNQRKSLSVDNVRAPLRRSFLDVIKRSLRQEQVC